MRTLSILALAALATAQNYLSSDAARANGTPVPTAAAILGSAIHPDFDKNLNYLRARADDVVPGVYVCKGPGWTTDCIWQRVKADVCMALPDSPNLAVGPDIGNQCMFFSGASCDGHSTDGTTVAPGVTNFNGYQGLSSSPLSYKCKPCTKEHAACGAPGQKPSAWTTMNRDS